MLCLPSDTEGKNQDEALPSYVDTLSHSRFRSLTQLYFVTRKQEEDVIQSCEEAVKQIFASLVTRGVEVKVMEEQDAERVADQWERETMREGD